MQPGDLRRFKEGFRAVDAEHLGGRVFIILEVITQGSYAGTVNILVEDGVKLGWGYPWVKENSETISEAG